MPSNIPSSAKLHPTSTFVPCSPVPKVDSAPAIIGGSLSVMLSATAVVCAIVRYLQCQATKRRQQIQQLNHIWQLGSSPDPAVQRQQIQRLNRIWQLDSSKSPR